MRGSIAAVAVAALVCAAASSSWAQSRGTIVFGRKGSLWRVDSKGKGKPREIARTGRGSSPITRVETAGATVLIEKGEEVLWTELGRKKVLQAQALDCKPRAHLSPDGTRVLCLDGSGHLVVYGLSGGLAGVQKGVLGPGSSTHLGFVGPERIVMGNDQGVWAVALGRWQMPRQLMSERPDGMLLIAPSGRRAVAVFLEDGGASSALYTFRVEGKGVRRRMMKRAVPLAWSQDSRWVLVQQRRRACLVRAVGGEYKCWRGFEGVGIAPDGSYALLVRKSRDRGGKDDAVRYNLYKGERDGVRPEPPVRILRQIDPAAAWVAPRARSGH